MSTMTKVFVVLTAVLAIALSVLTVGAAAQWANYKQLTEDLYKRAESESVRRMNLEATMSTALAVKDDILRQRDSEVTRLQGDLTKATNELAGVRNDLARRENEAVAAEAGRKKLEEIVGVQTAQLTALQQQGQVLQDQNMDLQTRNQQLISRQLELSTQLTIATDQNRNLQEKLFAIEQTSKGRVGSRATITEEPPAGAAPVLPPVATPINGEVMSVKGNYAAVNIGESSGVVKGMVFMVYRGSTYLADLEIETVSPKEAGGRLSTVVGDVRSGDRVRYGIESAGR